LNPPLLLTNDDGYQAEGLLALWRVAQSVWDSPLQVVAPRVCWSQKSHATITHEPIRVEPLDHPMLRGFIADAYPADCVRLGLKGIQLFEGNRPIVLSGINPGGNVGIDIYYSGTVAAAREAVAFGSPGMALSQLISKDRPHDWETTVDWASETLRLFKDRLLENGPTVWNINFPLHGDSNHLPPIKLVPMSIDPLAVGYSPPRDGDAHYRYSGSYHERPRAEGTDVAELFAGSITVTPLRLDHTVVELLK